MHERLFKVHTKAMAIPRIAVVTKSKQASFQNGYRGNGKVKLVKLPLLKKRY